MIVLKIDVKKIDKSLLFTGAKGTYLDAALVENKGGEDEYGNAGFISQSVSKEARERGEKGPIIGNWKHVGGKPSQRPSRSPMKHNAPPERDPDLEPPQDDDIPF